jgi:hypothetical protein
MLRRKGQTKHGFLSVHAYDKIDGTVCVRNRLRSMVCEVSLPHHTFLPSPPNDWTVLHKDLDSRSWWAYILEDMALQFGGVWNLR